MRITAINKTLHMVKFIYNNECTQYLISLFNGYDTVFFYYDTDGSPMCMSYNGLMYYYVKNLQGDIVKIINQNGLEYAEYVYDAWGNILSETGDPIIRNLNPFRYRGYVYDTETNFYYLQSRYYDPSAGRFINADEIKYISPDEMLSSNLFTYCSNNPVNYVDLNGMFYQKIYLYGNGIASYFVELNISSWKIDISFGMESFKNVQIGVSWDVGEQIKNAICEIAKSYLLNKDAGRWYIIAYKMFCHGLFGEGNDIGPDIKTLIINELRVHTDFQNLLAEMKKEKRYRDKEFEFSNPKDLFYSIQHSTIIYLPVISNGRHFYRTTISDTYDFTEWRSIFNAKGFDFAGAANDLGYILQKLNLMTPYYWMISYT